VQLVDLAVGEEYVDDFAFFPAGNNHTHAAKDYNYNLIILPISNNKYAVRRILPSCLISYSHAQPKPTHSAMPFAAQ